MLGFVLLFVSYLPPYYQQLLAQEVESLRGLSFAVVVEGLPRALMSEEVSAASLKAKIEMRLREKGVPFGSAGFTGQLTPVILGETVPLSRYDSDFCFAVTYLTVSQWAYPSRDLSYYEAGGRTEYAWARTWSISTVLWGPRKDFVERVSETIMNFVDIFIDDYLSVNPPSVAPRE
jgi:hypothetical protein